MIKITDKNDCIETINSIKRDVINTRHRIMRNANKELINLYYREYSILPPAVAELPWTLDIIDVPIGIASYNIINKNDILDKLPTEEDINTFISLNT